MLNGTRTKSDHPFENRWRNRVFLTSLACVFCTIALMTPVRLWAGNASRNYFKAEAAYRRLRENPRKQKYRDNWLSCIEKFQLVYRHDPSDPWASAGLYMTGKLYRELYRRSYLPADRKEALDSFERLIKRYPKSKYSQRAAEAIRKMSKNGTHKESVEDKPTQTTNRRTDGPDSGSKPPLSSDKIAALIKDGASEKPLPRRVDPKPGPKATVVGLRHWSNPTYTRVVVDADRDTTFTHHLLRRDPDLGKPQRLYVDLNNSRLNQDFQKSIPIDDNLLSNARAGQYTSDTVRVVVDIKSFETYRIFPLKDPFRIVIDIRGENGKTRLAKRTPLPQPTVPKGQKVDPRTLYEQLALGVERVVIDPGHGGRDYGAPGYLKGVYEKDVVLAISKRVAEKIRKELKCEVIMTRNSDRYLTLEERTALANERDADLFISIHTNSHKDRRAFGIETYILNFASDKEAIQVAAFENATSTKNISDLQTILSDLMKNAKINESSQLASLVQTTICHRLKKNYSRIKSKGVKQAPFYVLLGAEMPSILVETSFISNRQECKRLVDPNYQNHLATAIVNGVGKYIREKKHASFIQPLPNNGSKG